MHLSKMYMYLIKIMQMATDATVKSDLQVKRTSLSKETDLNLLRWMLDVDMNEPQCNGNDSVSKHMLFRKGFGAPGQMFTK